MKRHINYYFLMLSGFLLVTGLLFLSTLSAIPSLQAFGNTNHYLFHQLFSVSIGLVLGFIFYYKDKVKGYGFYGLAFLLSGVIGNLIDRLLFGYVRDFIDVGFWPIFNLADSYNTTGVILLVIWFWKNG